MVTQKYYCNACGLRVFRLGVETAQVYCNACEYRFRFSPLRVYCQYCGEKMADCQCSQNFERQIQAYTRKVLTDNDILLHVVADHHLGLYWLVLGMVIAYFSREYAEGVFFVPAVITIVGKEVTDLGFETDEGDG